MSGFSADWLALREPVDARSRWSRAADLLAAALPRVDRLRVIDLGGGTGANYRHLAPLLPAGQDWLLLDDDPQLLQVASVANPPTLTHRLQTQRRNLVADWDAGVLRGAHLVTASALLDLVSAAWLTQLAQDCRTANAQVLMALSYDGRLELDDVDPDDGLLVDGFNQHQRGDKGFGPALGPDAAIFAVSAFEAKGYAVRWSTSDWRLGAADQDLQLALLSGWAAAVAELWPRQQARIAAWLLRRSAATKQGATGLLVGHRDLVATLR